MHRLPRLKLYMLILLTFPISTTYIMLTVAKPAGAEGSRKAEGISINRGLLALSNVINALSEQKNHVCRALEQRCGCSRVRSRAAVHGLIQISEERSHMHACTQSASPCSRLLHAEFNAVHDRH